MDALVWIVDSNDRERLPDCKSELDTFLHDCDRPVPILVLANKQDLPNKLSAQEVIDGLCLNEIRLHNWAVFPTCITSGEGIREAFQWLEYQFSSPNDRYQPNPKAVDKTEVVDAKVIATLEENAKEPVAAEANVVHKLGDEVVVTAEVELGSNVQSTSKLFPTVNISPLTAVEVNALKESKGKNMVEDWLSREQVDSDSVVIKKLKSCSLPIWDHYTHVHIAWILLKDHPECLDERFSEIASLLQAFIAKSPLTNGKSFHHTMTYFWCHMIAYTLKQMKRSASTSYDQNNEAPKAFHDFLEASLPIVDLWKGSLFKDYYSGTVIFSASAKTQLLKPDLKPLPW